MTEIITPETLDRENQFKSITEQMAETYSRKNHDYGNSFEESLNEDGIIVGKIRLQDKFFRFKTLIKSKAKVADESIEDTLLDLATYCIMIVMWMRNRKTQDNS